MGLRLKFNRVLMFLAGVVAAGPRARLRLQDGAHEGLVHNMRLVMAAVPFVCAWEY
ncbi:hypothetical protein [Polaromonas sp.]|uniref:hypothetical protein n=1 Tax=Polaromonas sp. TaxID=1869339 RepID=UPI002488B6A0|nr:hypothetical protein [Polaromonas sp.]MDI1275339.1 hypothetical protein [Polaromonas sp.]